MTNEELISKIKAEIERRYNKHKYSTAITEMVYAEEDEQILSFISTLESEKPNDKVVEGEVILNGHGLLVDVTKWGDGYKLKVIIKEN